jgi:hypothetical protein
MNDRSIAKSAPVAVSLIWLGLVAALLMVG